MLEDTDGDGVMDKRTVFADKLVLPRALKVLDPGALVGEPPNLWLMKDTDGDLKADTRRSLTTATGGVAQYRAQRKRLFWGIDNTIYISEHDCNLLPTGGEIRDRPHARARPVGRVAWTMPGGFFGT